MTTSDNRPRGWVEDHVRRYLASDGEDGHIWNGVPTLLLTTTGRRSGRSFTTPLIYGRHGEAYVIVASKGGAPRHPDWFMNLSENPEVGVQVAADKFTARARTAGQDEKPTVWATMAEIWPEYDLYQTRTSRVIPVVILERVE